MWLLHPQYWFFEALALFLLFLVIFRWFCRSPRGRKVARDFTLQDGAENVVEDVEDLRQRAQRVLPQAEEGVASGKRAVRTLRQAAGFEEGGSESKEQ